MNLHEPYRMDITIPAYGYPTIPGTAWYAEAGVSDSPLAAGRHRIFILNPASGPGTGSGPDFDNYTAAVKAVRITAGVRIFGYVNAINTRPLADIIADVKNYILFYKVDGVYLDQVDSGTAYIPSLYGPAISQISGLLGPSLGLTQIILGTGVIPAGDDLFRWKTSENLAVTYENFYSALSSFVQPRWMEGYNSQNFCFIIHDATAEQLPSAVSMVHGFNGGQIYVTDGLESSGNPYQFLPSYWSSLIADTQPV